ncbi:hypothetical protein BJ322DRAFT_1113262 [Thelephora terrestris]|uniref:Uncharacterized protein n=1 Tax=Thelephora terrestris TaxID=56493 RepID=A0A9P6H4N2_9AGAM|nr:hypothetical protein BJ322DRAFT_1113262 [Thelephora terrestris]
MADHWCECDNCRGSLVVKGTWYIHNKAQSRHTLVSTYNPPRTRRAQEDPPDVASSPRGSLDVKEPPDEVDPPDNISRASRSDSDEDIEDDQRRQTPLPTPQPPTPHVLSPPPRSRPQTPPPPPPPGSDHDNSDRTPPPPDEFPPAQIPKIHIALEFIRMLGESTLASQFGPNELEEFLDPRAHDCTPLDDRNLRLSLMNFVSFMNHSQKAYEDAR